MKKVLSILSLTFMCLGYQVYGQSVITGRVLDGETSEPLIGATVLISSSKGTTTNLNGEFRLVNVADGSYTLTVTYIGYEGYKNPIEVSGSDLSLGDISLAPALYTFDQVVVTGTRKFEKITETPATIEVISSKDIAELPSFNPGELLSRLKGVEFVRSGVVGTGINIRGFNSNFNAKNLQVNDGRFSTLIATGLPFGPLTTQIKEDIDRVEVILGPNAALYGPNAHNGLVHTITKDPRSSQGTTVAVNAGNQSLFSGRFRHAQVINDKISFKVMGEYTRGEEFEYVDSVYIDRVGAFDADGNPIPDGVNEAYEELELDRDFEFFRGEAALYYSVGDNSDIILGWGGSNSTYLAPTNVGRNQIIDWRVNYYHLRFTSPNLFAQVYYTTSKTDDTYSIDDRTKQYWRGIDAGLSDEEARGEFSYQSGARFVDNSKRWNAEIQYNRTFGKANIVVGAQWQRDIADSEGTYLLDEDGIEIDQLGVYGQLEYRFNDQFKAVASFRGDNHEVYDFNFIPKAGLVYSVNNGAFRLTYGKGIAAPTILNMYGDLFSGLILGNSDGFTLIDGSTVEKQTVEKIQTFELGYKGQVIENKLFVDANAFYNISEDFLSPVTVVGVTTQRGDTPIQEVQSGFGAYGGLVATYINFGKVNTFGFDLGTNLYINDNINWTFNYSYFDYSVDENNEENDFNNDGVVNKLDILVNAPKNRFGTGLYYRSNKLFGNVYVRWVQEFDYFSSFQIAAETQDLVYRGTPVVENARSTDSFNYGPLGGFTNVDIGIGYRFNEMFTLSGQVTNLFDSEIREFTASPFIGRLYSIEAKLQLPAIKPKK